jgi:hypothetical protein
MPLSLAHHTKLLQLYDLFDKDYLVPSNPWCVHSDADDDERGSGLGHVFRHSYHSPYPMRSYRNSLFNRWKADACRYQPPRWSAVAAGDPTVKGEYYPFSMYGGTPVEADFALHRVERARDEYGRRTDVLLRNRFGCCKPLPIGPHQFSDCGLLQDWFMYEYRPFAALTTEQRSMPPCDAVYISNFLAFARTHAILALSSASTGGKEDTMVRLKMVRNLYRFFVETAECTGASPDDDGAPVVIAFQPKATSLDQPDDRPIMFYACSLRCINGKLAKYAAGSKEEQEGSPSELKAVYACFNDAVLLYTTVLREKATEQQHDLNYTRALAKRMHNYSRGTFDKELIKLLEHYIYFLHNLVMSIMIQCGGAEYLKDAPLQLLEQRDVQVPLTPEYSNTTSMDMQNLSPHALQGATFGNGAGLTSTQLYMLDLVPLNHQILGTLMFNGSTEIVDFEEIKKQIIKNLGSGPEVWQMFIERWLKADIARKILEGDGTLGQASFAEFLNMLKDPGSIKDMLSQIGDPVKAVNDIGDKAAYVPGIGPPSRPSHMSQKIAGKLADSSRMPLSSIQNVVLGNGAQQRGPFQALNSRGTDLPLKVANKAERESELRGQAAEDVLRAMQRKYKGIAPGIFVEAANLLRARRE